MEEKNMKYCQHCGKELNDDAVVCVGCGCAVTAQYKDKPSFGMNLLAFLFPIVGWIYWGVTHNRTPKKAKSACTWAWIGFVISFAYNIYTMYTGGLI